MLLSPVRRIRATTPPFGARLILYISLMVETHLLYGSSPREAGLLIDIAAHIYP
jgi:hypothetical protein